MPTASDIIFVENGTYVESVIVDKPLTLEGENTQGTIVDGNDTGPSFLVESDNVTITGFMVRNVLNAPPPSDSLTQLAGIHLLNVQNCSVFDNIVVNCGKGVWIYEGSNNKVLDNDFIGNNYGVLVESSAKNTVTSNIAMNGWGGIVLDTSNGNIVKDNIMSNNSQGFAVTREDLNSYANNIDSSNIVNGNKVYYTVDQTGLMINPISYPRLDELILVNCTDVTVENLQLNWSCDGIHIVGAKNSTVTNSDVVGTTNGVWIQFSSDCTIFNNTLEENGGNDINVEYSCGIRIADNNITETDDSTMIRVYGSNNFTIAGNGLDNPISSGTPTAIDVESSNGNNITSNFQTQTAGMVLPINLQTSSNNTIQLNRFYNGEGILIEEGSNYNNISNNIFGTLTSFYDGIILSGGNYNNISENTVGDFLTGLALSASYNNTIAYNTVTSQQYAVILDESSNNTFVQNQLLGSSVVSDMGITEGNPASVNIWK